MIVYHKISYTPGSTHIDVENQAFVDDFPIWKPLLFHIYVTVCPMLTPHISLVNACKYVGLYVIYNVIYIYISGWWFGTFFIFHFIYGIILPIDELIFFRGVGQPLTSICTYIYI